MIGDMTTLARPYATAAFEYALQKNMLSAWEGMLRSAAILVEQKEIVRLLSTPAVTKKKLADLFCEVLSSVLDTERKNFIRLLAEYNRLALLPDIAKLFSSYCADREKSITVQVTSAVTLDEKYQQKLAASLAKRLARQVTLQCKTDTSLLGGLIVRADDLVIDGSVRGKLNRLFESL
jgi:F-type H+-transporting ATPase subunit delta